MEFGYSPDMLKQVHTERKGIVECVRCRAWMLKCRGNDIA